MGYENKENPNFAVREKTSSKQYGRDYISTCVRFHFDKPRENRTKVTTAASINGKVSIALDHIPWTIGV